MTDSAPSAGNSEAVSSRKRKLHKGDIFSVEGLIDERDRAISFFREEGFAFFNEDSLRITVDTTGTRAGIHYTLSLPDSFSMEP